MTQPGFEEFVSLAEKYEIVPLYTTVVADKETPITLYEKLTDENPVFLLESGRGREKLSRYSFIGFDPFMTFESYDSKVSIKKKVSADITSEGTNVKDTGASSGEWIEETKLEKDPLTALKELYKTYTSPVIEELPRFYGGGVGYFGYETINFIEENKNFSTGKKDNMKVPDICLVFPKYLVIYDHLFHKLTLVKNLEIKEKSEGNKDNKIMLQREYEESKKELMDIKEKVITGTYEPTAGESEEKIVQGGKICSPYSPEDFKIDVEKAKNYIEEGDIFQVVLSRPLEIELEETPWEIYRVLRTVNPSPYMYYLDFGDFQVVGASPEMLVRQEGSDVYTRPIAGTRPRGKDEKEDESLASDLQNDPKERAEHLMLIDLGRNDVGKISQFGSVEVTEEFKIEHFSHVMHMVSEVKGKIAEGYDFVDVLKACFPAGTVTGAPKIRAMEIIDEFEPTKRGPYSGGVGYMAFNGNMDVALTIRTLLMKEHKAFVQAGAGIVADSIPENEYQETLSKAKALIKVIETARDENLSNYGLEEKLYDTGSR